VAWISEQKNTLSLLFAMLSALAFVRFDDTRRGGSWAAAFALFVLALLTKTVTATLPAVLLVLVWWRRGRVEWRRDVVPLVPWFTLAVTAGLLSAWVERSIVGAEGAEFRLDPLQHLLVAGRVPGFYLGKLLWPAELTFTYARWTLDAGSPAQWLFPLGALALTFVLWRFRSRSRGPLAGWLIFCAALAPVLGFLNVYPLRYSFVADHFQYHASLGVLVPASAAIAAAWSRLRGRPRKAVASVGVVTMIGACAVITRAQSATFVDSETLYRATLLRNPDSWMAHHNLGRILARSAARRAAAISHFAAAIRLKPDHARAHFSLGTALEASGRSLEAIDHFERAIVFEPGNPMLVARSHLALGVILTDVPGRLGEATAHLEEAVRRLPSDAFAYNALGVALGRAGRFAEAQREFEEAVRLRPEYAEARQNLQGILRRR
jgi:Flp pilus assembly protein TadD